ncbi:hypothetical protein MTR67_024076 [Solanum verrucosum]|uniref:Uncharacterized protein n=1 Tax=Solanum verrucosum TaxID=315347 RepID=A0AAF0QWD1_SOLVR|nr:hypothetical protein MTR67_024076 [Solanum verrucosum]
MSVRRAFKSSKNYYHQYLS